MSGAAVNIHATAIVAGTRGLLFLGASGQGKSALAFACITESRRLGAFAALVADDRVLVSRSGKALVAQSPKAITGLIELRGSGIVAIDSLSAAVLDVAIEVVSLPEAERLPPEKAVFSVGELGSLPLVRLWSQAPDPLAHLAALMPLLHHETPFSRLAP
jgi:serine kinase of HPr protein (carbohydrate metabolism regulator)